MSFNQLKLRQLNDSLRALKPLAGASRPRTGWIRAIREALGMTSAQLASRVGVARQSLDDLERFRKGETLAVVVQGKEIVTSSLEPPRYGHEDTVNKGRHVIQCGGKFDSHLLAPVVRA
jgi:predicted acyl esterase